MTALLLAIACVVTVPSAGVDAGMGAIEASALTTLTREAARQALGDVPVGKLVGVYVEANTPELAQTTQSLLMDALTRQGAKAATAVSGASFPEVEQKAREQGLDALVRVRVGLEGPDLTLAGDRIGTWVNFWDGHTEIRQLLSAALACRAPADAAALTLARVVLPAEQKVAAPTPPPVHFGIDPIARIPARVLAMALIDADGDGHPELALLTPTEVLITRPDGEVLFRHDHAQLPEATHPSRDLTGGLVATDGVDGHRLAYAFSGQSRGESLTVDKLGLHLSTLVDGTPLCAGPGGAWFADLVTGTNIYGPTVKRGTVVHDLSRAVIALRANPGSGEPAFLAILPDGQVQPLAATMTASGALLPGVGEAAVADLDGDGVAELVTSSATPIGGSDQVRILRLGQAAPAFQGDPIAGSVLASCAGDLDGDGKADVILAAAQTDGSTTLLRVGVKP